MTVTVTCACARVGVGWPTVVALRCMVCAGCGQHLRRVRPEEKSVSGRRCAVPWWCRLCCRRTARSGRARGCDAVVYRLLNHVNYTLRTLTMGKCLRIVSCVPCSGFPCCCHWFVLGLCPLLRRNRVLWFHWRRIGQGAGLEAVGRLGTAVPANLQIGDLEGRTGAGGTRRGDGL